MNLTELFQHYYSDIRVKDFETKYLPFSQLDLYLENYFPDKIELGKSVLENSIYLIKMGNGPIKILVWSQMHGNESTGTRAMLDVLEFLKLNTSWTKEVLEKISFHFIPMLNPDGASVYTRRNAVGVDLNRDFVKESSPEIRILKKYVNEFQPDFLFNLHDQRSIFNVGESKLPATLAFLAPSPNRKNSVTLSRLRSMAVIDAMYKTLQQVIPNQIARFSDEFYPTSTGDNFMQLGFSSILFEAGHYPNDYQRNEVRKWNALAILSALEKISQDSEFEQGDYFEIPPNNKLFLDIILRNVKIETASTMILTDIGIYFEESLNPELKQIVFKSRIEEIGDLSYSFGHIDWDAKGELFKGKSDDYPILNAYADFSVGHFNFEKGILNQKI
ncbi:MAG: M14 family zinc carboxypeptidase [Weeksellaceae bacterium]|jgi:hypothetical protein|nr:M14 family zinc carboxypeptidase [Weeksellaceae bacterium]